MTSLSIAEAAERIESEAGVKYLYAFGKDELGLD